MAMKWQIFSIAVLQFFLISFTLTVFAADVYIGHATCGTTIPMDSQYSLNPAWSLKIMKLSTLSRYEDIRITEMYVDKITITESMKDLIRSESGINLNGVVIFELNPQRYAMEDCKIYWNPLKIALDGVEATSARLFAFHLVNSDTTCTTPTPIEIVLQEGQSSSLILSPGVIPGVANSISFSTRGINWPITFQISSNCTVRMLLLLNRQGTIHELYVWIPVTVFSGVVIILVIFVIIFSHNLPAGITAIVLTLIFLGFLGSCIGLVLEVVMWQTALGPIFPFPDAITLFCCFPILYILLFVLILYRHRYRDILTHALLRLLIYGLNCGLCCGYWVAGYVVLGSLTLLQFIVSNLLQSITYSYFVITLEKAGLSGEPLSNAIGLLWFAPITPFSPCALMYYDLFAIEENSRISPDIESAVKESVIMYNILTSIPLIFLQNIWGITLLAVATVYHMPFIIIFFPALILFIVQFILLLEQYARAHRRWSQRRDLSVSQGRDFSYYFCCCPLWSSIEKLVVSARRHASEEAENTRRYLDSLSIENNRRNNRIYSAQRGMIIPVTRTNSFRAPPGNLNSEVMMGNEEMLYYPSSMTVNDDLTPQKEDYWPSSIGA